MSVTTAPLTIPVCERCAMAMRIKQNGVRVTDDRDGTPVLWRVDLWHCPACGLTITHGSGAGQLCPDLQPTDYDMRFRYRIDDE